MVGDWLERADPAAPALEIAGRTVTYGDLDGLADLHASRLVHEYEMVPGDVAAIRAGSALDVIATMWGAWRSGMVVAPFASDSSALPERATVVETERSEHLPPFAAEPPGADAVHTLVATSGSTGRPKHVILTHRNVGHAVEASIERLDQRPGDRWLLSLPLHHVGGLSILWRSAAVAGCVVVAADSTPAGQLTELERCQWASVVPTTLRRLVDAAKRRPSWGSTSLSGVLVGGARCPVELLEEAIAVGIPVLATYGMTETCSQMATMSPGDVDVARGTVGFPLAGFQIDIDGAGQIWVSGAAVSPGYWGEPPRRGPLPTGDRGSFDGDGRLVVFGRVDALIISGGENVHPERVEAVIDAHPGVVESAVVGVPDAKWGERVEALVRWAAEERAEELERYLMARLERWEVPKAFRRVARVPRTAAGKIDRSALSGGS